MAIRPAYANVAASSGKSSLAANFTTKTAAPTMSMQSFGGNQADFSFKPSQSILRSKHVSMSANTYASFWTPA